MSALLDDYISKLEQENAVLRYKIDELLGSKLVTPVASVTEAKFRIVNLLARRSPMTVPYEALHHAMNAEPERLNCPHNALKVHVSKSRAALKAYGIEIETIWGVGYRMPPESKSKWQALVEEVNT